MILTMGWKGLLNHRSMHNAKNKIPNLDKPSYPTKITRIMSTLLTEFENMSQAFLRNYSWINHSDTKISITEESIIYINVNGYNISFKSLELGRVNTNTGIWSWSWVDEENNFLINAQSQQLRDYGSNKSIEVMTKANWSTSEKDTIEILALCAKLKSAIGVEVQEKEHFQFYYLILEKL